MLRNDPLGDPGPEVRPDPAAAAREADRGPLVERILAYQEEIGAPEEARRAAESLRDPKAVAVVTGQQPGLLGGPLLTLAKAMSAIAWAERLGRETGAPAVAVFWAAAEDHDLDEVNRVDLLDAEDEPVRLSLPIEAGNLMLSETDPGPGAADLLVAAEAGLPRSEFLPAVMADLAAALAPSLSRWFSGILTRWLGGHGLVVVEPAQFRAAARGVLDLERARPGAIASALGPGPLTPVSPPFFRIEKRRRVRPQGHADLPESPEAASWDVVTRVLAQNLALPVAGHVVGPSEERYCRQIAPAHELLGIPAPPLLPRARLILVEGKIEKSLHHFGAGVEAVLERGEDALTGELVRPEDFDESLSRVEAALAESWPRVTDEAGRVDEVLLKKALGAERELMKALDRLRDHGRKAMERATGRDVTRRQKVLGHLLPGGAVQERVLSPLPFLARHGTALVPRLLDVVRKHPSSGRIVYLGRRKP